MPRLSRVLELDLEFLKTQIEAQDLGRMIGLVEDFLERGLRSARVEKAVLGNGGRG